MKTLFTILLPFFLLNYQGSINNQPKNEYYFFCISNGLKVDQIHGYHTILYTKVSTIEGSEILPKTSLWKNVVNKKCENEFGCSSDLNYYRTWEEANAVLQKFLRYYSSNSTFVVKEVPFE
jgi:hypothetical protein